MFFTILFFVVTHLTFFIDIKLLFTINEVTNEE